MSEICASCLDFDMNKIVKSKDSLSPKWLSEKDHVRDFIGKNQSFTNKVPQKYNVVMKVNIGMQHVGKKVLYWAAKEKTTSHLHVNDAKSAYGNFSNSGIVVVNNSGEVLLKLSCPQIYHTIPSNDSKPHTYYRHLHLVISNDAKNKWAKQIYTKIVVCRKDLKSSMKYLKSGECIFINALPSEYYGKDHIPNSYNITHNQVKKMSQSALFTWLEEIVKLHYPKIYNALKKNNISLYEIPIITYCAHEKCNASELLIEELMKKGMVNVNEYSGGMKEYNNFIFRED
tara:strand:+ start:142 stop:999 length:858 start_codon:yes stop_codon:yes gene_type:complete